MDHLPTGDRPRHKVTHGLLEQEIKNPLEPLLVRLIKGYVDDADLTRRLSTLYRILDR